MSCSVSWLKPWLEVGRGPHMNFPGDRTQRDEDFYCWCAVCESYVAPRSRNGYYKFLMTHRYCGMRHRNCGTNVRVAETFR